MKRTSFILAVTILSVALALSSCKEEYKKISFNDLPQTSKEFLNTHFADETISYIMKEEEMFDKTYEVYFTDGDNVDFDKNGEWDNIDCHSDSVPSTVLDIKIINYINNNHNGCHVVEIDKDRNDYNVELNNGLELVFDNNFDFERYDD